MALPARRAGTAASSESTETIATLLGGFSLEATFPSAAEIEALKKSAPAGTRIYLSCPPNHSAEKLVEYAVNVRNAGFEPVPHLTARAYPDRATLDTVLSRLTREAAVRSVLAIAGDRDDVAGPFEGALALIESGALEAHGITEVDISGYPDGHPKIDNKLLEDAMAKKLPALARRKLAVNITTQFCFEPDLILAWIRRIRASGIDVPLRVGVAGPTSMRALMRLALRCGVRASVRGAMNPKTMQLFGDATPDEVIRALAEAEDRAQLGNITVHFFSFGGLVATSDWAVAVAEERITPTANGFRVIK
jgi:methylenetetrahydrofolate reductase (NADPH)